jgi:hypothetical protein
MLGFGNKSSLCFRKKIFFTVLRNFKVVLLCSTPYRYAQPSLVLARDTVLQWRNVTWTTSKKMSFLFFPEQAEKDNPTSCSRITHAEREDTFSSIWFLIRVTKNVCKKYPFTCEACILRFINCLLSTSSTRLFWKIGQKSSLLEKDFSIGKRP